MLQNVESRSHRREWALLSFHSVCLSVCWSFRDLQPTTIDRSQPNLVGRSDPCKPFWIPCLPYFGCQRKNMQNFAYFQCVFLPLWTWRIVPYELWFVLSHFHVIRVGDRKIGSGYCVVCWWCWTAHCLSTTLICQCLARYSLDFCFPYMTTTTSRVMTRYQAWHQHCHHGHYTPFQTIWAQTNNFCNSFIPYSLNKLCPFVHHIHIGQAPQYLSDCVSTVSAASGSCQLRLTGSAVYIYPGYILPRTRTRFGERGFLLQFSHRNTLPSDRHDITDTSTFRKWLQTVLLNMLTTDYCWHSWTCCIVVLYKFHMDLLIEQFHMIYVLVVICMLYVILRDTLLCLFFNLCIFLQTVVDIYGTPWSLKVYESTWI